MTNILPAKQPWDDPAWEHIQTSDEGTAIQLVTLNLIEANPFQTRVFYDEKDIVTLAEDIRQQRQQLPDTLGLLQVPKGRLTDNGRVQLGFGHRRLAAFSYLAQRYGSEWQMIPVQIEELTDEAMADMAWSENEVRADISAIEKAWALQRAMTRFNYLMVELAQRRGMPKSTLSNLLRLLQLPDLVQQMVLRRELQERHARALLPLIQTGQNEAEVIRLATVTAERRLSVSQLEEQVAEAINRLTVEIEMALAQFRTWGNLLPNGCSPTCPQCPHFGRWKHQLRCSRPELYQQKYQAWWMKTNQAEAKEADELNPTLTDTANGPPEPISYEELNVDEGLTIQPTQLSIFKCPRCGQKGITVDGVKYQCPACRIEWPTVVNLLNEINAGLGQGMRQVNGSPKFKRDLATTQVPLTPSIQFVAGQTWNAVPTTKCLGWRMTSAELKESLNHGTGEFMPEFDGTAPHFCQYLRLFPHYIQQFIPKFGGTLEIEIKKTEINLYPAEVASDNNLWVHGESIHLLHNLEAYCADPAVHQANSCFQQQEADAAQAEVAQLTAQGLPAVLPHFVKERKKADEFIWLQPQVEGKFCTPESCLHREEDPLGYMVMTQPGGNWQMVCVRATCGGTAQAALIDREAEQQRLEQHQQQAALDH